MTVPSFTAAERLEIGMNGSLADARTHRATDTAALGWDRKRACVAAADASKAYGTWVPQGWLDRFFDAYEKRPDHAGRRTLLGPPRDMLVAAILMSAFETDPAMADLVAVEINDALANAPDTASATEQVGTEPKAECTQ